MLRLGSTFDRYTIEAVLGEGGMGTVYRARDAKLNRAVALKVLRGEPAQSAEQHDARNARLLKEARSAAALSHANAVAIYDVGEIDGVSFISMELIEGRSLRAFINDPALSMDARIAIVVDVARALGAAHEGGLIHRDIKPENVMIRADGEVKVLDFGLARAMNDGEPSARVGPVEFDASSLSTMSREGAIVGTPRYMAPEQLLGEPLDARTDQFSWGVLAYELVTGKPPWAGDTASLTLVSAVANEEPPPPDVVEPKVPEHVSRAIMRAMSKSPDDRFASMNEAVAAIDVQRSTPPKPVPVARSANASTNPEALQSPRPRSRVALVAPLALLVGVAGVVGSRFVGRGERPAAPPPASAAAVAPAPTTVTDLPVPASEVPEAKAAYVAGLHALRGGSIATAATSFVRATELDPSMAAAHLRIVVWAQFYAEANAHEHFGKARELRARLSERDQAVLWAIEPWYLTGTPDELETSRRAREIGQRWPLDADLQLWIATRAPDTASELAALEKVLAIDPEYGFALMRVSNVHLLNGSYEGSLAALDRCVAIAPSSNGCLSSRANAYEELGRCTELERDARLLASTVPSMRSHDWVARALYANGAPIQAVRGAFEQKWGATKGAQRELHKRRDEAHLAILRGDFVTAEKLQRELAAEVEHAQSEDEHGVAVTPLVELLLEVGDLATAAKLADQYLKARAAWMSAGPWSALPEMMAVANHGGLRTDADRATAMAAWTKQWDEIEGPLHLQSWVLGWAIPASTEADARAALAVAPSPLPRVHANQFHREGIEANGRVLLLAGRAADAVPYLRAATASCSALQVPLEHTQAHLHLGQALEQTKDAAGACAAYKVVLDRWGAAKPRSVSADRARARVRALKCP